MRLEHFLYVVEIAECRSMSKAARNLYITQPSLSVSLQNLENELGFQVFERSHKGMVLTQKGQEFYQIAQRIQKELIRVEQLMSPEDLSSEVRLSAVPVFCNAAMLQLMANVREESASILLSINETVRTAVFETLIEHTADLAVGICIDEEEKQLYQDAVQNHISIEPMVHDRMYIYLPKHHSLAFEESVSLDRLEKDGILTLKDTNGNSPEPNHKGGSYYTFSERDSVLKAVSKGMGYAILPGMMAIDNLYVETGLVAVLPIADGVIPTTMYLAYSAAETLTRNQSTVAMHIRKVCRKIQNSLELLPKLKQPPEKPRIPSIYY